ncbi:methylated-DNA--[protein]-cysteine S-methyltransferase [Paenibacillus sp. FSL R7-0048]|jgi:methylated-DNA-[protein]-cysteine S-methyltransferase|uniref:methylated-DNA--[protein]-cysteine S-methyltransferase n=1 Tax=Paenibacillus TaxID=44249 RepID=UPI00096CD160|nr:methylated-DNA--[protein]-cysteine S-methyltransferase [Paenibacillus odorifer]OMC78793.1 cysteine methyltransferase [Paenibacillus odorifer]OMD70754.1 cysteine methyltransferase [Paenibacillus odorifer]OMD72637.1 cysteine methyltransferase [Paenibacillus odorifer]
MENKKNAILYWTLLTDKDWSFYIAATEKGLSYVGSQQQPFEELSEWVRRRFPGSELVQNDEKMAPYVRELSEYLQGNRQSFGIPFDYQGTPFQLAVWKALCEIPYGQTWSYSDIATHIQRPAAVRAVGTAIGANPILITVPCHRVIGKNGTLTGYRGGLDMKTKLLQLERGEYTADI